MGTKRGGEKIAEHAIGIFGAQRDDDDIAGLAERGCDVEHGVIAGVGEHRKSASRGVSAGIDGPHVRSEKAGAPLGFMDGGDAKVLEAGQLRRRGPRDVADSDVLSRHLWMRDGRSAVSVERVDGFQTPSLAGFAFLLGPDDGLPIGVENCVTAGGDFDAIAAGFVEIEKKRLTNGMFVRAGFDEGAAFAEEVGHFENIFARFHEVSDVVETTVVTGGVFGDGDVV